MEFFEVINFRDHNQNAAAIKDIEQQKMNMQTMSLTSDSDEGSYGNLVLEETPNQKQLQFVSTETQFTALTWPGRPKNQHIKLATESLKQKTNENQILIKENKKLTQLLAGINTDPQQISPNLTQMAEELTIFKQKIVEYEIQLQNKDRELKKQLDALKQNLKRSFSKKSEIQKEILEEMEERCNNMESNLSAERKVRDTREAEVVHLRTYIDRQEKYNAKQMEDKENQIKLIEASNFQEIEALNKRIKAKNEELSLLNKNYSSLVKSFERQIDGVPLEKKSILTEMKIKNLEHSLQQKINHLNESYVEIDKLQEELKGKRQSFFKQTPSKRNVSLNEQLEDLKQKIEQIQFVS